MERPIASDIERSSEELVLGGRSGDKDCLNEIYTRFADRVYFKCRSIVKNETVAHDLAHDVFIKVFTNLDKLKNPEGLGSWIFSITYNHCVTYLRQARRLRFEEIQVDRDPADTGEEEFTEKMLGELRISQLARMLDQLKEEEQIILLLKYQEGLSVLQIGRLLDIGESAVKMRLKRSRTHLAELYRQMESE
ncbi:RNA polymerase sigma-70 factor (ECF subfamily) [Lewinella aquimaris]|uniref:RNA polymerase sigma-70 factor (ECF subfamily) n=1 Tax=Neolewinella aquimaris TaxID=1835722 RepID=A0A840E7R7_9BACT|nr:sigma-70 family RNA polymerase sigma factor [Neolewinella aquimaris]MBB4079772.1 RNA polymerase sigma-70 factor (ECF subfamily) [Neolewinella aquimaris]